jgi:hypothetical protein
VKRPGASAADIPTVNAIRDLGVRIETVDCDLADLDAVRGLFQRALDIMGGEIHVLVNCAGIQRRAPAVDFAEKDWDDVRISYAPPSFDTYTQPLLLPYHEFMHSKYLHLPCIHLVSYLGAHHIIAWLSFSPISISFSSFFSFSLISLVYLLLLYFYYQYYYS